MSSHYEDRMEEVEEALGTTDSAGAVQTTQREVLGELKGKIVERAEVVRQDPEVFGDVLTVYFTDGTTLRLEAGMSDLYGLLKWTTT